MLQDLGYAPVAALSLALGIGANSAVLSLADGMLLRPMPIPGASGMVVVNRACVAKVSADF